MISTSSLSSLRRSLALWYEQSARDLPWRRTHDPYHIWLSEVILQQTQVVQGLGYYHRFIEAYPTIVDLAAASEDEVLRLWQGLGYYSRGRNLLRAARMVVEEYGGQMPRDPKQIERLPGVGFYTQAAVLSFAYNLPHAAVDGNVYRVLSRFLASSEPIDTPRGQKFFRKQAAWLLDPIEPGRHNQAMIELGALCCTPRRPECPVCPLVQHCQAHALGRELDFPVKQGRVQVTERYLHYFLVHLRDRGQILIRRRGAGDIWQGLYELPLIETLQVQSCQDLLEGAPWQQLCQSLVDPVLHPRPLGVRKHRLTHRLLHASLYLIEARDYLPSGEAPYLVISAQDRGRYAMPILLDKLLSSVEL